MAATRLSEKYIIAAKLRENVLPTNEEVLKHYYFKRRFLQQTSAKFVTKCPEFNDLKYKVVTDVVTLWVKSSLPTLSISRIQTKLLDIVKKLRAAKRRAIKKKQQSLTELWLSELFDISSCKCKKSANPEVKFWNGKFACICPYEKRIPEKELEFLEDQRSVRRMILTSRINFAHQRQRVEINLKKRRPTEEQWRRGVQKRSGRPRKNEILTENQTSPRQEENTSEGTESGEEFDFVAENTTAKSVENVTKRKCVLADRRGTSLRQQADQLTPEHFERAGTSKSSVHRKKEKYRLESLKAAESKLASVDAWQLCFDGKIINGIDRYVFVSQYLNTTIRETKITSPVHVKTLKKKNVSHFGSIV